jgi:glycosyltransferase involved in cell wall biosynthesis
MSTDVSIVIPVKDERENVGPLLGRIDKALDGEWAWECVFVDDGSTDGTFEELARLAARDRRVRVLRLRRTFGQSAALQAGFDAAAGRLVVTMDGDLQNDPADVPRLLAKLDEGYDAVLGWRENRQDDRVRVVPSRVANWLIRRVLNVPFRDLGCSLRVMRREFVDGMRLYGEMHRFVTALLLQQGARVTQVPVRHHPRGSGRSKYSLSRWTRVLFDMLTVKFFASYQTRPMHLFGTLGAVCLAAGWVSLLATVAMKWASGQWMTGNPLLYLSVLLEVLGVQFLSLGLVGEVVARTYFESQGKTVYAVRTAVNYPAREPGYEPADPGDREPTGPRL